MKVKPFMMDGPESPTELKPITKSSVYHKSCPHCGRLLDVYNVLEMFGPISHSIGHAIKKLLMLGKRNGGKPPIQDANEAIQSIERWREMQQAQLGKETYSK